MQTYVKTVPSLAMLTVVVILSGTAVFAQQEYGNGQAIPQTLPGQGYGAYPPANATGGPGQGQGLQYQQQFQGQYPQQQYPQQQYSSQQQFPQQQQQFAPRQNQQPFAPQQFNQTANSGNFGGMSGQNAANQGSEQAGKKPSAAQVYQWFLHYDEIRRRAQMNPIEKQQADGLLARGFSLFMPGQDKIAAKQLLTNLVHKYHTATQSIKALPMVAETKQLQMAYYQYFENAMNLFSDYLRVQDNVFAVDASGQAIAKQLIQRKVALETLEQNCKNLDGQLRQKYGVAAYQY